jgi:hypothetical protein
MGSESITLNSTATGLPSVDTLMHEDDERKKIRKEEKKGKERK